MSAIKRFQSLGRIAVLVFAASLLAGGLTVNPATAKNAGACGWYSVERWGPVGQTPVWDTRVNATTWLSFEIVTYNDGCGNRFYRLYEWDTTGTVALLHLDLRVWVCGGFQGWYTANVWSNSGYIQSPATFNWGCGRQADDYGSGISSGWFSPGGGSVYVTAG